MCCSIDRCGGCRHSCRRFRTGAEGYGIFIGRFCTCTDSHRISTCRFDCFTDCNGRCPAGLTVPAYSSSINTAGVRVCPQCAGARSQGFCTITNGYAPIPSGLRTVPHGNGTAISSFRIIPESHRGTAPGPGIGTEGLVIIVAYKHIIFIKTGAGIIPQRKAVRRLCPSFVTDGHTVISNCTCITADRHCLRALADSTGTESNRIDIFGCRIMPDCDPSALISNPRCCRGGVYCNIRTIPDGNPVLA